MYDSRLINRESYGNASSEILAGAVLPVIICNELRSHKTSPRGPARPGPHMYQPARPRAPVESSRNLNKVARKFTFRTSFHFVILKVHISPTMPNIPFCHISDFLKINHLTKFKNQSESCTGHSGKLLEWQVQSA